MTAPSSSSRPPAKNRPARRSDEPDAPGWIWGKHAGAAALANPARHILEAVATRNAARDLPAELVERVTIVDPKAIDAVLPPQAVHQGLAVKCRPLPAERLKALIAKTEGPLVVLDQITDPHNVGAIIRSAAAFGAAGVVLQDRKSPPLMGACAKAAVGAVERLAHVRVVNVARAVEALGEAGLLTIGLMGQGEDTLGAALACADGQRVALVLGAEDKGLRPGVAAACGHRARIPIAPGVESLNVSTAAAVALYALTRR